MLDVVQLFTMTDLRLEMHNECVCVCVSMRACAFLSVMDQPRVDVMSNRSVVQAPRNHVASGQHALCICSAN